MKRTSKQNAINPVIKDNKKMDNNRKSDFKIFCQASWTAFQITIVVVISMVTIITSFVLLDNVLFSSKSNMVPSYMSLVKLVSFLLIVYIILFIAISVSRYIWRKK